jgi:peptide/nickel transport system substrate-binding protein
MIGFIPDKKEELERFKNGSIHLIFGLPSESISEMVEAQIADFSSNNPKYYLHRNSELATSYYQFNITRKPFDNIKVRQAFSYALNRDKIISDALNTEAFGPGICGLTPPGISGYDITEIKGYTFSPERAKKLLAEAGYPGGRNFPHVTVETNSGGGKHVDVVDEVKRQLKSVLNVELDFVVVPFAQKLEDAKYGRAEMFRSGWVADYPTPESFLRIMYGAEVPDSLELPSYPNTVRYKNHEFDSLFRVGSAATQKEKAYDAFIQAEEVMMRDAPILILWYGENLKMNHSYVKNFFFNSMNYKDFSEVYIKKPSSEKP